MCREREREMAMGPGDALLSLISMKRMLIENGKETTQKKLSKKREEKGNKEYRNIYLKEPLIKNIIKKKEDKKKKKKDFKEYNILNLPKKI